MVVFVVLVRGADFPRNKWNPNSFFFFFFFFFEKKMVSLCKKNLGGGEV